MLLIRIYLQLAHHISESLFVLVLLPDSRLHIFEEGVLMLDGKMNLI